MKLRSLLAATAISVSTCFAAPPDLERADAKRILEFMEWKDVSVIAIRQGVNAKGEIAPIYATILGFASRDGKNQQVTQTLTHDKEIGWHHLELQEKTARIWTKEGYTETRVWTTWWNGTTSQPAPPSRPSKAN
jgi:hypothetical protein